MMYEHLGRISVISSAIIIIAKSEIEVETSANIDWPPYKREVCRARMKGRWGGSFEEEVVGQEGVPGCKESWASNVLFDVSHGDPGPSPPTLSLWWAPRSFFKRFSTSLYRRAAHYFALPLSHECHYRCDPVEADFTVANRKKSWIKSHMLDGCHLR